MSNPALIVRKLVTELRDEMSDAARELRNRSSWDLQCPVIVIDARKIPRRVLKTSVRGLTGTITTSNVIDNPLLRSFLRRVRKVGIEAAHEECRNSSDSDSERVFMLWERYSEERRGLGMAVWSYSDAAKFALKSKQCFEQGEIACVAITEGSDGDDHGVLTFSVNSSWLS
tara:strand:- start:109 stop:621 length:513 start_codon:yes stop_codon:yes gene_type:complete